MRRYQPSADVVAERRVAQAARRFTPPGGTSLFMEDTHLMSGVFFSVEDASDARMSSMLTRRMTNQHGCTGGWCWHRNHRRDVHYMAAMLDVLGLAGGWPAPTAEDYILPGMRGRQ